MFGVRKATTGNFVHNDEIWKDHVRREMQTSRRWPVMWGFLAHHQYKPADCGSRHQGRGIPETPASRHHLPPLCRQSKHTCLRREARRWPADFGDGEDWSRSPVVRPAYPQTTAREVGWRNADILRLEKYGRHARGQKGIRKLLNWPREAIV